MGTFDKLCAVLEAEKQSHLRDARIANAWREWRAAPCGQDYPPHKCPRCLDQLYEMLEAIEKGEL